MNEIKNILQKEKIEKENVQKSLDTFNQNIENFKSQINEYERQIIILRRHNDELDSQLKTGQSKISTLENELVSNKKEIEKISELNQRLQKEKQEILK